MKFLTFQAIWRFIILFPDPCLKQAEYSPNPQTPFLEEQF